MYRSDWRFGIRWIKLQAVHFPWDNLFIIRNHQVIFILSFLGWQHLIVRYTFQDVILHIDTGKIVAAEIPATSTAITRTSDTKARRSGMERSQCFILPIYSRTPDCFNILRPQLVSDAADVFLHHSVVSGAVKAPHLFINCFPAEYLSRVEESSSTISNSTLKVLWAGHFARQSLRRSPPQCLQSPGH